MESSTDPKVQEWTQGQNQFTRVMLDKLPGRDAIRQRVTELLTWQSPAYFELTKVGSTLLAMKSQPPKQQPMLVTLGSPSDTASERVLVDPMVVDPSGKTTIDFFVPSPDGKKVAVSLSKNGTRERRRRTSTTWPPARRCPTRWCPA